MKKLMIAASVAAVGLAAVADVYNVKFTTTTPVVASKKVSGTDTAYLKKGTVTINGVCSIKNGELGKYYFWSGTGKTMAPLQNSVFELSNITNMDANVNGKNAALNVALYVGSSDNELVSYFVSGGLASMEVAGGSNFKSASGSFGGTYGSLPAYGTWSLSKNAAATKVGDDDRGMAEYVAKQGAKSTMGKSGPVVVSDWQDNSEFAAEVLTMADLKEKLKEIDVLISVIKGQGHEIATLTEEVYLLEETIAENEETIAENEAKIAELTENNEELSEELAEKVAELEAANAELQRVNAELADTKAELEATIAAKEALEVAVAELEATVEEQEDAIAAKDRALDTLKALAAKLEEIVNDREATIADQAATIEDQAATIEEQADAIAAKDRALDTLKALVAKLEEIVADREATIEEQESAIAAKDRALDTLKALVAKLEALVADREATIEDQAATIEEQAAAIVAKDRALDTLKALAAKLEEIVNDREATIAEKEAEIADLNDIVAEQADAIVAKDRALATLKSLLAKAEELYDALEREKTTLEEANFILKAQLDALDKELNGYTDEETGTYIPGVKAELEAAKEQIEEQLKEIAAAKEQKELDDARIAELEAIEADLEDQLAQIEAAITALDDATNIGMGLDKLSGDYLRDIIANQQLLVEQAGNAITALDDAIKAWQVSLLPNYQEILDAIVDEEKMPALAAANDKVVDIERKLDKQYKIRDYLDEILHNSGVNFDTLYEADIAAAELERDNRVTDAENHKADANTDYDNLAWALEHNDLPNQIADLNTDIANIEADIAGYEADLAIANTDLQDAKDRLALFTTGDGKPNYQFYLLYYGYADTVEEREWFAQVFYPGLQDDVDYYQDDVDYYEGLIADAQQTLTETIAERDKKQDLLDRLTAATPEERAEIIASELADAKRLRDRKVAAAEAKIAAAEAWLVAEKAHLKDVHDSAQQFVVGKTYADAYDEQNNEVVPATEAAWLDPLNEATLARDDARDEYIIARDESDDIANTKIDRAVAVADLLGGRPGGQWLWPVTEEDPGYADFMAEVDAYNAAYGDAKAAYEANIEYAQTLLVRIQD